MNQAKSGIGTLDYDIPEDYIFSFVVEFIGMFFPQLEFDREEKNTGKEFIPLDSMLKLFVHAKIQYIDSISVIVDMVHYHDVFRYVLMMLGHKNIQFKGYRQKYGRYFEILFEMKLKKVSNEGLMDLIMLLLDGTVQKSITILNNNVIPKKKLKY